jgi:Fe-S cluster biosynthesis and repair protein YggX
MMTKNENRVPRKQWAEWNERQRALFNHTYTDIMHIGRAQFLHPMTVARKLSAYEFKTIAWNAAWVAADQLKSKGVLSEVVTIAA